MKELTEEGKRIQELQDLESTSDDELAKLLQVSSKTLWNWKRGQSKLHPIFMMEIERILNPDFAITEQEEE